MSASEPITTISDSALLMGCFCTRRLIAPPTHSAAKMKNKIGASILVEPAFRPASTAFHDLGCSWPCNDHLQPGRLNGARNAALKRRSTSLHRNHKTGYHNIRNRQRQQKLPAKGHELVVAETWQRPPHPNVDENERKHSYSKPNHGQQRLHNR